MDCTLELASTLHFGHAATNLFMSQPALSYQIKTLEKELGFTLFERSGRGAALTPAGSQFCLSLRSIRADLQQAVEQGQNVSSRFRDSVRVGLPYRSALPQLPRVMARLAERHPDTSVTPVFGQTLQPEALARGELDVLFAMGDDVCRSAHVRTHPLRPSRILLITRPSDALARKDIVLPADLRARTLMVGGGSPPPCAPSSDAWSRHWGSTTSTATTTTPRWSTSPRAGVCVWLPTSSTTTLAPLPGPPSTARRPWTSCCAPDGRSDARPWWSWWRCCWRASPHPIAVHQVLLAKLLRSRQAADGLRAHSHVMTAATADIATKPVITCGSVNNRVSWPITRLGTIAPR